jgi:superfamily II DNA or RNA helicase
MTTEDRSLQGERLRLRFLREAPFLPNAGDLGVTTSAVTPWPHQLRTVREVVRRFPESFLFCDEVGLGKTVEAGLALRQLAISGRVRRALLLVPKSLLKQWQEELHEKTALEVPRFTGGKLLDVRDRELRDVRDPWNAVPVLLASSQLARRRDRREQLLAADPWDLVLVDEAHHARRRGFLGEAPHPNRLLELLTRLRDRTRCLYLLTATPMQVHPVEVWDLLRLLGLGGLWGSREDRFLGFFEELRKPFAERDWDFLLAMLGDHFDHGGELDPGFRDAAARKLGREGWQAIEASIAGRRPPGDLDEDGRAVLDGLLRRHMPLRRFSWRATRDHLRAYRRRGLLDAGVPDRRPRNVWIDLTAAERRLYERIERYASELYQRYEARRHGLGFVMTVYRRRLTSSFHAIRRSLERRRRALEGDGASLFAGSESGGSFADQDRADEAAYLDRFLADLRALGEDSKLEQLTRDLEEVLAERDAVLVFTQYVDTMDHLRDALRSTYGGRVACYSGRGGERWDGAAWTACGKESLKEAFRRREVAILLCTEAAGEGLNLQTCGVLINYDMPWNPMRVEQRIGRIDRIGQAFDEILILNYFYRDTVEATIYQRLGDRIRWFEEVVGTLEPILHHVGDRIRDVAMAPGHRRARRLEEAVAGLRRELDERDPAVLELIRELDEPRIEAAPLDPPVRWREVEETLTGSPALEDRFTVNAEIPGAYRLAWDGREHRVTFSPDVFDRRPYSLSLLTWGSPLFDELLRSAEQAPPRTSARGSHPGLPYVALRAQEAEDAGDGSVDEPCGVGLYRTDEPAPVSLFLGPDAEAIVRFADLEAALSAPVGRWREAAEGAASVAFSRARRRVLQAMNRTEELRQRSQRRALAQAARQVLVRSALLELARARTPGLFDAPVVHGFGTEIVRALAERGAPFDRLLEIAGDPGAARADDPFFAEIEGRSSRVLERRRSALLDEGEKIVAEQALLEEKIERTRLAVKEPSASGILERRWFPLAPADEGSDRELPFRILKADEVRPFRNSVPLYDSLEIPAGLFTEGPADAELLQADELRNPGDYRWVELDGSVRAVPRPGLFVARVVGESVNRRVPDGSWCLFRLGSSGSPEGKIVLAGHHEVSDPELGGRFTLKIYESETRHFADGSWQTRRVVLKPSSTEPGFEPIVLQDLEDGELQLIAELVAVLG